MQTYNKKLIPIDRFKTNSGESNFKVYEEMVKKDSHIFSLLQTRKHSILSKGFDILPYSNEKKEEEKKNFIQQQIESIDHFQQDLYELLSALEYGFSVLEIQYKKINGTSLVDRLKFRHPKYFRFNTDLDLCLVDANGKEKKNLSKKHPYQFIIHRNGGNDSNPYGDSLLTERIYWLFFYKKNILEFVMSFVERFGQPIPFFKYPEELSEYDHQELDRLMRSFHQEFAFKIPKLVDVNFLEWRGDRTAHSLHESILKYLNNEISKAILGQTLTSDSSYSSSFAHSKVHLNIFEYIIRFDTMNLENTLNYQLVRPIIDLNFGKQEKYPRIKFRYDKDKDWKSLIERDQKLYDIGVRFSSEYFRKNYNLTDVSISMDCSCENTSRKGIDKKDRDPENFDKKDRDPENFDKKDKDIKNFDKKDKDPENFDKKDKDPENFDKKDKDIKNFDKKDKDIKNFDKKDRDPDKKPL